MIPITHPVDENALSCTRKSAAFANIPSHLQVHVWFLALRLVVHVQALEVVQDLALKQLLVRALHPCALDYN
jgi:hypothetical protein